MRNCFLPNLSGFYSFAMQCSISSTTIIFISQHKKIRKFYFYLAMKYTKMALSRSVFDVSLVHVHREILQLRALFWVLHAEVYTHCFFSNFITVEHFYIHWFRLSTLLVKLLWLYIFDLCFDILWADVYFYINK